MLHARELADRIDLTTGAKTCIFNPDGVFGIRGPITYCVFEGCHVTRDIPSLITESGLRIEQMETGYLAAFPKSWSYYWWGTAIPESQ